MRKTPVTLGVLSMVFGGLVALYSAFGVVGSMVSESVNRGMSSAMSTLPRRPGQPDPSLLFTKAAEVEQQIRPYRIALAGGKLLCSLALVVIGVGLYKRKRWSRTGAIAWGSLALAFLVVEVVVNVRVIQPRIAALMRDMFAGLPEGAPGAAIARTMSGMQTGVSVTMLLLFLAPYPIVLLALCGRRSAAADFVD